MGTGLGILANRASERVRAIIVDLNAAPSRGSGRGGFWEKPQGAAIFKHALLEQYAPLFASKVGKRSPNNEVVILDGYAGRGWYADGSPGSPARMVATAERLARYRNVRCYFVEEDVHNFEALTAGLESLLTSGPRPIARHGSISQHLAAILSESAGRPMFAFLDPFGLGLPFEQLTNDLMGRGTHFRGGPAWPPTEVLVNFVHAGIYRNAGMVSISSSSSAQQKAAARKVLDLDANLGGPWWRAIWAQGSTADSIRRIREGYVSRVLAAAGQTWRCVPVPVSDVRDGSTIYDLLFFTQHPQGVWFFNDAVSLARKAFEKRSLEEEPYQQLSFFDPETEWVLSLRNNLLSLLRTAAGRSVRVIDHVEGVYGELLGIARGKHVKAAAKMLASEGLNAGSCTCEPDKLVLARPNLLDQP